MFHFRIHPAQKRDFRSYPLRYASKTITQYLTIVKLPGSFRLAAGKQHLHCYCIFTGRLVETVFNSLGHSCGPELTRQGITLPLDDYSYRRRSLVLHSVGSKYCYLPLPNLTFQHWSGLTPYTSSYELAGSCVFDKQSLEKRLLQPSNLAILGRPYCELTATCLPSSLTRFLPFTLAYLRLSTCVGLRYGFSILFKYSFSRERAQLGSPPKGLPVNPSCVRLPTIIQ